MTTTKTQFLSPSALRAAVPAAFATSPHDRVSEKYHFVPTTQIIKRMDDFGFLPVVAHSPIRKHARKGTLEKSLTGPHLIQFEPERPMTLGLEGKLRVSLINSHDRSKRFSLRVGFYRHACDNSLIAGLGEMGVIATHIDSAADSIDDAIGRTIEHSRKLFETIDAWRKIKLRPRQLTNLARRAMAIRFGDVSRWSIEPAQLLHPRRPDDEGVDLWRVFNRVQENCTKGGIRSEATHFSTVDLERPRQLFDINTRLWDLAASFAAKN